MFLPLFLLTLLTGGSSYRHLSDRSSSRTTVHSHSDSRPQPIGQYSKKILSDASLRILTTVVITSFPSISHAIEIPPFPSRGFQTKSGLKYFDLSEGDGASPRYGQLISFQYTGYFRPDPNSKLEIFDSSLLNYGKEPFLHKHGNGRIIRGIDEGLHTMKVGGKRRLIIPKSLGFTEVGIGPVPIEAGKRRKLSKLLDLVEADKGELVYDIELVMVADDENDQGYYDDIPVSQEEVRELVRKAMSVDTGKLLQEKPK